MLIAYDIGPDGVLAKREPGIGIGEHTVWVDLVDPTREEDLAVEQAFGIAIPTQEEMQEIEASSRLYQERGAHYMTAVVLFQKAQPVNLSGLTPDERREARLPDIPEAAPVTFVLSNNRLVTVRYHEPRAFSIFLGRNQKGDLACGGGGAVLVGLLETIIDREADRVERMQLEVERLGHAIFGMRGPETTKNRHFDLAIRAIGKEGEVTSRSRESLHSLHRLLTYLPLTMAAKVGDTGLKPRIKTAARDVESLRHSVDYLSHRVQFLLDATLGLINIQQNNIIKFFTVVSVALMPPTLIASLYGMNFKRMPELEWIYGYPMAVGLMILAAVVPITYFKRKGWM